MVTPRLGAPELVSAQATPETTVNEIARYLEQGANFFVFKDRDLATPPGSPSSGDCYLVASSPTGAWTGQAGKIAFRMSTSWLFITALEGMTAYVNDEDIVIAYNGSAWGDIARQAATDSEIWAGSNTTKFINPAKLYTASAPVALTSSTSITPNGSNGFNFSLTLAHDTTLENPTNFKVGQSGLIVITQDGTGTRTMAYGTFWKFPGGAPVLTTAAGAVDLLSYYVVTSSLILATVTKGYSS
jgi:hypothetical protein